MCYGGLVQDQFNQALWAVAVVPAGNNITRASKCLGIGREVSLLRLAQASSSISPLNVRLQRLVGIVRAKEISVANEKALFV